MGKRREKAAWKDMVQELLYKDITIVDLKIFMRCEILAINTVQEQKDKLLIKMKSNCDLNALL